MITYSGLGRMGRLGNQMFQIAATLGHAYKYNTEAVFPNWEYAMAFKKQLKSVSDFSWVRDVYREPSFEYSDIPNKQNMDLCESYLQSEKYFAHCKDLICEQFEFIDDLVNKDKVDSVSDTCAIHVRRTDYLRLSDYHPFPGMDYYLRSISEMESLGRKKFTVFSDDIQWCMQAFGNDSKFVYITGQNNIQDLCLMSKCHSNIIANSSFSWWGAWLNSNNSKHVIAPDIWFGPANAHAGTRDLYCEGWVRL